MSKRILIPVINVPPQINYLEAEKEKLLRLFQQLESA
jgi:hypothetical protein